MTEGTSSNVFVVSKDKIMTPQVSEHILSGITRKYIIDLLKSKRFSVVEEEINILQLYDADEIWMTSSTKEIYPVRKVDDKEIKSSEPSSSIWFKVLSSFDR